eukprot:11178198-Lingulodinium_polyedra.AAC.1
MKSLDEVRAALAKESPVEYDHFRVTVLGGQGLYAKTKKAWDNVVGLCMGGSWQGFLQATS